MGTFAETAKVDYRLSFADQGKLTSVFHFASAENKQKFAASVSICTNKRKLLFSVSSVFCIYTYILKWQHIYRFIDIYSGGQSYSYKVTPLRN
jgi:hypothetical protein